MSWLHRALDASVVLSFDRTGFRRHARAFVAQPERDLRGAEVIVTGGTAGIGLAAATALAARGARVTAWARGAARASAVEALGGRFTPVDLGDLDAVRAAADAWSGPPPAAVLLNAGAMPLQRTLSPQGHELVWASQVLGHVALLRRLHARGRLGPQTRVVWVSSGGMYLAPLDLHDLRCERGYQRHAVYARAKRAQVELNHLLAERWPEVWTGAMHPGWVDTEAVRLSMPVFRAVTAPILRTPEEGADTLVWLAATASALPSGRFWFDRAEAPSAPRSGPPPGEAERRALWAEVDSSTR